MKLFKTKPAWIAVLGLAIALPAVNAFDDERSDDNSNSAYAIGLWGDLPYDAPGSTVQDAGVKRLIADMNAQRLAFTAHDGDLKAGGTLCANDVYYRSLDYFNSLKAPAVFTPGDNDWTDCDRVSNGSYNSLERLGFERQLFFSTAYTLGQSKFRQEVQATPLCLGVGGDTPCVENRRWVLGRVMYATLNVQGSCNNLCDTAPDPVEFAKRNAANIAWLQQTFAAAKVKDAVGIMLISQGNPGFDLADPTRAPLRNPTTLAQTDGQPDGFKDFLVALRTEAIAFVKPSHTCTAIPTTFGWTSRS